MIFQKDNLIENLTDLKNFLGTLPKGTRIGYWILCGVRTKANEYEYEILRKNSDFVVGIFICAGSVAHKIFAGIWSDYPKDKLDTLVLPMDVNYTVDKSSFDWFSSVSDATLVLGVSDQSNSIFITENTKSISEEFPDDLLPKEFSLMDRAFLRGMQTVQNFLYPYILWDVQVKCYIRGLWIFVFEKWVKEVRGKGCLLIPPYREDGIAISFPFSFYASQKNITALKDILQGKPLISEKNITSKDIQDKFSSFKGRTMVKAFTKYSGSYLDYHKDEGDTYIFTKVLLQLEGEDPVFYVDGAIL